MRTFDSNLQAARDQLAVRRHFDADQAVRDLLSAAVDEGLVRHNGDPQQLHTGDLAGVANLLTTIVNKAVLEAK